MGGSTPSASMSTPAPAAPTPIDYDAMYAAAQKYGGAMLQDQTNAILNLYPQMTNLQFQTADQLAAKLNNDYLKTTQDVVSQQLEAARTPTQIEALLQQQALNELALGRSLTPEQQRAAEQSARSAFASRGLGTSAGAAAAEILNRDAYATQRENERRTFALGANQLDLDRQARLLGLAGAYGDLDPYRQGLNMAFQLGSSTLGQATGTATDAYNNALSSAGMVDSFNANMSSDQYNSWMNNNAAIQAANMSASATNNAATMGMIGSIGSSIFSDKRMKKDIKPLGSAGKVLGLTAYEYRYKGDNEKRVGFMAQDVKRVLPQAVKEITVNGKKRLTIKPQVIGNALAKELSQQAA
jgi:hypothetical protein